jgi:hypothetical protein
MLLYWFVDFFPKLRYLEAKELNLDAEKTEVEKEEASRTQPSTETARRPRIDCTRSKSTRLLATFEKVALGLKSGRAVVEQIAEQEKKRRCRH